MKNPDVGLKGLYGGKPKGWTYWRVATALVVQSVVSLSDQIIGEFYSG